MIWKYLCQNEEVTMKTEEKALHFIAALLDVYRDEENRELEAFSKQDLTEDATEDVTAMLIAFQFVVQRLAGYDGDLIDFTHVLNKLAVQHIMDKQGVNLDVK